MPERTGDRNLYYLDKVKFENIFQNLKDTKAKRLPWGWAATLLPSLFLPVITAENFIIPCSRESKKFWPFWGTVVVCVFWLLFILIRYIYNKKTGKWDGQDLNVIKNRIIKENIPLQERYTIMLIVPIIKENGISFLAAKHPKWENAISLPYFHCKDEKGNPSKEIFDNFTDVIEKEIRKFTTVEIYYKFLDYMSIEEKKLYQSDERVSKCNYKFVLIYPRNNFLFKRLLIEFKKYDIPFPFQKCSVDEMMKDTQTIRRNYDIAEILKLHQNEIKDICQTLNRETNKLIWNICEECDKECDFCVYGDKKNEPLQKIDVQKMLERLLDLKIDVIEVSTGNSVDIDYLKEAIKKMKDAGYRVNLSATATIMDKLGYDFLGKYISTIKFSYSSTDNIIYNNNYEYISRIKQSLKGKSTIKFRALVVLEKGLNKAKFDETKRKLADIGVKDITLMRLMPVDKTMPDNNKTDLSDITDFLDHRNRDKKSENIIAHCAFVGINSSKKSCKKGITKLGMSPNGDLYICPWGEHLKSKSDLFKIGNIMEDDNIADQLNKICPKLDKNPSYCSIFKEINGIDHLSGQDQD